MNKQDVIESLRDTAENYDARFVDDYSGRGMYGKTCVGVILEYDDITEIMFDVYDETGYRLPPPHTDSMGMDTIYYWPGLKVEEAA